MAGRRRRAGFAEYRPGRRVSAWVSARGDAWRRRGLPGLRDGLADRVRSLRYDVPSLPLSDGRFHLRLGLADASGERVLHWLDDALEFLRSQLSLTFTTEDIVEGVTAFFEKRDPQWKGR